MDRASIIAQDKQLKVVADPHRLAILRRIMARPTTISQLGREFGKHPAWMRHHFMQLESAGLIELVETRQTRNYTEKFYGATAPAYSINLLLVPDHGGHQPLVALASHDLALEMLASLMIGKDELPEVVPVAIGSLDGLIALRQGLADVAGCHLLDADTGDYNVPYLKHLFPDRSVVAVTFVEREQGLIVASGNPLGIRAIDDLARPDVRLVNRNRGSGTRLWLDQRLHDMGVATDDVSGYDTSVSTHLETALAVAAGHADVGVGIRAAAARAELGFVPMFTERYDLVVLADRYDDETFKMLIDRLQNRSFRSGVRALGGYDTAHTGDERRIAV